MIVEFNKRTDRHTLFKRLITVGLRGGGEIDLTWPFWIIVGLIVLAIVS